MFKLNMGLKNKDEWVIRVLWHFKQANSGYIMYEIVYSLPIRPVACIKEIIRLR